MKLKCTLDKISFDTLNNQEIKTFLVDDILDSITSSLDDCAIQITNYNIKEPTKMSVGDVLTIEIVKDPKGKHIIYRQLKELNNVKSIFYSRNQEGETCTLVLGKHEHISYGETYNIIVTSEV